MSARNKGSLSERARAMVGMAPAAASPKAPPEEKEGFFSGAMSALASAEHAMEAAIVDGAHRVADGASNLAHEAAHLAHLDGGDRREPLTDADGILAAGGSASAAPEPQSQPQADSRAPPSYSSTTVAATQPYERSQMPVQPQAQMQMQQQVQPSGVAAGDDLSEKLAAWKALSDATYEGLQPCAAVKVTVLAGRGLSAAEPSWVAHCAGQAASSGAASSYYIVPSMPGGGAGVAVAGGSAPSWSAEPLSLPVYDVTADLALFLCNNSPEGRRAVGRVVVPLTQLLPLNPFRAPQPLQGWAAVFPLGAQGDGESASLKYAEAVPGAPGVAMAPPPQGLGAVLIKVELHLHRSLIGSYLLQPAFEPTAVRATDAHTGYDALPPEQLTHSLLRLLSAFTAPPALIVASTTQPLLGIALLLPLGWLLYGMRAAAFPWWLLLVWLANGAARRRVRARQTLNPWEPPPPAGGYRSFADVSASDKLALLHSVARPLAVAAASVASDCERLFDAPSAADPLALMLSALPALIACAAGSLLLGAASALVWLAGGLANLLMGAAAVAAVVNLVTFYQAEIIAWAGSDPSAAASAAAAAAGDKVKLLPPGVESSSGAPASADVPEGPMSPEKALLGLIQGGKRIGSAWDASASKAAEIARKPTAQKMLRASSAVVTNLWRRLPDRLEATHRAIARAAIRQEEVNPAPGAGQKADEYSA